MKEHKINICRINNMENSNSMRHNQNDLNNRCKFLSKNKLNNNTNNYNNESSNKKTNILGGVDIKKLIKVKTNPSIILQQRIDNFKKNNSQKTEKDFNPKNSNKSKKKDNIKEKNHKRDNNSINKNYPNNNKMDSKKIVNNKNIDLNNDKSIFNEKSIKIFVYIFYYEEYVSKNKYKSFNDDEKYYLINPVWISEYKNKFNYEEISKSLLNINEKHKNFCYNNLDDNFNYIYNELLCTNINFKEKELGRNLPDLNNINCSVKYL